MKKEQRNHLASEPKNEALPTRNSKEAKIYAGLDPLMVFSASKNRVGKPTQKSPSVVAANAPAASEIPSARTVTPNAGNMHKQDGVDCLPEFATRPRYKTTHGHAVQNKPVIDEADSAAHGVAKTFTVSAMHLNHGIFIPGVDMDEYFGEHGSEVQVYFSGVPDPKIAKVDRNSNSNKSCRLNLGASFKKWLAQHFSIGMSCGLEVVPGDSPTVKFFVLPAEPALAGKSR